MNEVGSSDGKLEVLLADDEGVFRRAWKSILEAADFSVRLVPNGAVALQAYRESRPDVVILEGDMPIMDGYAVCRVIRKLDREIPIVFLSALDREEDQIEGLGAGADDYVSKVASKEMIVARVRSAIARARRFAVCEAPDAMTKTEANIYRFLRTEPGRVFSYREIFAAIVGEGYYADEGSVRTHISHLRRKLPRGEKIEAKRGQGFYLTAKIS